MRYSTRPLGTHIAWPDELSGGNQQGNTVSVIDTATSAVTGLANGFAAPRGVAVARS